MENIFIQFVFLILIILGLVMLANKLKVAYPIVLVLGGLALSFTPMFPNITIQPNAVFFIFLPPLLYEAAWQTSWKEFWRWRRVITSFAFPIVIITSFVIAYTSRAIIPGFTLAMGFLLGGIISPPDAVSATTIMRNVKAPKPLVSILEGESLLNDASSLIVFRFALLAVITGQFNFGEAAGTFLLVVVMGILIGVAVGWIFYLIHRLLPTTSSIEILLTLVTPYCMYYAAEHFHFSGVLAVVSGGLLLASKQQSMLNYRSRIEAVNVWTNLVFVLNGVIFLLIGLELRIITSQLEDVSVSDAIWYGLAISLVLILCRFACTFGAAIFTRIASRFITVADPRPGWKAPLISGWAGMRGVVSLAAALSIPLVTIGSQPFPYRNLILFITFIVILVTLVLQGLTLPWVIRKVNMHDKFNVLSEDEQERIIYNDLAEESIRFLQEKMTQKDNQDEHLINLVARYQLHLNALQKHHLEKDDLNIDHVNSYPETYLQLLERQREVLRKLNSSADFDDHLIRKHRSLIDTEEYKMREKHLQRKS